ncbi:NmrA/HSCARG family protein [Streptomyces sp. NPDC003032]
MPVTPAPVLVSGGTGHQGGATVRALLAAQKPVRALVRDPHRDGAKAIQALGAELITGDLTDPGSLARALQGVRAVFSVQRPPFTDEGFDFAGELAQATNLIEAARRAGVGQFVQSSTSGVGAHTKAPGWDEGRWTPMQPYFETKQAILDAVRRAGFPRWTVIKPAFFMENLHALTPHGPEGGLATIVKPDTELALVAGEDIGAAAAHAIDDPDRFHEVELELAGDRLTMKQIAQVLAEVWGVPVTAPTMGLEEALAAGMPGWGAGHDWNNLVGQPARPEYAQALGIPLTPFTDWARAHLTTA